MFFRFLPMFLTFLGDFNHQKLPSRRLQTLWEWKTRVVLEAYYIFNVAIPPEAEWEQSYVVIVEDLNVHHERWLEYSNCTSADSERLYKVVKKYGLIERVRAPARDGYLLDLVPTSISGVICYCYCIVLLLLLLLLFLLFYCYCYCYCYCFIAIAIFCCCCCYCYCIVLLLLFIVIVHCVATVIVVVGTDLGEVWKNLGRTAT